MVRSLTAKMFTMMPVMVLMWADLFAYYILWMTMTYLTNVWEISFTYAAAIINVWSGASQMLPVVLAHLADAFVGDFTVLLTSTLSYCVGLGLLAMSTPPVLGKHTGSCSDYKPECIGHDQKLIFYIGLALIAVGTAGHLTSLGAFAADQLDEEDRQNGGVIEANSNSCNMQFCTIFLSIFAMVMVPIAGIIVIPYVKPWSVRYGIAAIFSLTATVIFLVGCFWYNYVGPQGSPLTTIVRVFVASFTKLFYTTPRNADQLYERTYRLDELLTHTNSFCCLDKAAIIQPNKPLEQQENNRWRLCSVTEVEGAKIFLRSIPMWVTFIACGLVSSVGNTYFLEQANHMNPKVGRLKVPLPVLLWFYDQAKSQSAKLYFLISSCTRGSGSDEDEDSQPSRYTPPIGIAVSMVLSVLCCITAAKVENRRLGVVASHGLVEKPDERIPMTIFWLLPQFLLLGAVDGLYQNSIICFFADQVGPSMRRYMGFLSSAVFGSGVMGSALSVYVVGQISERGGKKNWFQQTINKSRLDNYYWVLAALSAVNLVVFGVVAYFFRYRESRSGGMEAPEYEETDGDRFEDNARCCC